jgi:hypothetical protein
MTSRALLGVAACALLAHAVPARAARADDAGASYRILSAMLGHVAGGGDLDKLARAMRAVGPLVADVDARYGVGFAAEMDRAIATADRARATWALVSVALADAQDLVDSLGRDDHSAWEDAKPLARRARLQYELATRHAPRLRAREAAARGAFARLSERLEIADLATDPAAIETLKDAVGSELLLARSLVATGAATPVRTGGARSR